MKYRMRKDNNIENRKLMTGANYSVEVGLRCLGEVKVDDHVHSLNVNVSCQQVWICVCVHVSACVYTYTSM